MKAIKFSQLKVGEHFEFKNKTVVGNGIFNLVGIKKSDYIYRMGGINRFVGLSQTKVVRTKKELN